MKTKRTLLGSLYSVAFSLVLATGVAAASYNGTNVTPAADGKSYTIYASANDTVNLTNVGGDTASQIGITFKNGVGGTMVVTKSATLPSSASTNAPGAVNTYFDAAPTGFTNSDVTSFTWNFTVTKDWLKAQGLTSSNIFLYHWENGAWKALTTKVLSDNGTYYTLQATGSSFSPFAIAGASGLTNTGSSYVLYILLAVGMLLAGTVAYKMNHKKA